MHCNNWIFDMDGTLTDSMTVVWEGAPDALLARYGRTPNPTSTKRSWPWAWPMARPTSSGSMTCP